MHTIQRSKGQSEVSFSKAMRRYGSRATADTEDGWMCDADEEHHLLD
jgi:hypothetical protein